MLLSVIIPTCNRNELLGKCLQQLAPGMQTINESLYEVIVTDDSKNNTASSFVQENYSWARWVEGAKKGPAANRNNGAAFATGEWLVFLDDDCEPSTALLHAYHRGITDNPSIKVFEGATHADRDKMRFDEEAPVNLEGGFLFSCNFAIQKNYFDQLNGFDEGFPFPAMEDTELAYRIRRNGQTFKFLKEARVVHPWRRKTGSVKMNLKRFNSALYFIEKHPEQLNSLGAKYYLTAFVHHTAGTLKYSLKFRFRGIGNKLVHDAMLLYFAAYMFFKKNKPGAQAALI